MKATVENLVSLINIGKGVARSDLLNTGVDATFLDRTLSKGIPGFQFFTQRLENEQIYHLMPIPKSLITHSRVWYIQRCADHKKPYFWIQFPNIDWRKLVIVPLSDLQWGSGECDVERIKEYVAWIGREENVFAFINGDLIDNALASSVGGSVYQNVMKPHEQVLTMIELLRPIAHKILWAIPGNHEERTVKVADIDPLQFICLPLGIPYFNQPVFVNILWKGNRFNFYCFHGVSGSRTMGGKLNAAARPMEWTEFTMFNVMGHVHEPIANPITRRCILRDYDSRGKLKDLRIVDRDQYVIICSAWLKFWDSYAHRAAYAPPPQGATPCFLLANGGYEISQ